MCSSEKKEYQGRILDIDLSSGKTEVRTLESDLFKNFIGGSGINAKILYDEVSPSCDPLSADNILIFGFGPLVGSGFPASTRFTITSKSPLTGIYTDSNAGGGFGIAARSRGYDHIIIRGQSDKPVYLVLDKEGSVKIIDGRDLWGLDVFQTDEMLEKTYGKCESLRIGQDKLQREGWTGLCNGCKEVKSDCHSRGWERRRQPFFGPTCRCGLYKRSVHSL